MTELRAAALHDVRAAVRDVLAISRELDEERCRLPSVAEGWPAVIVAYHIGLGLRRQAGFIARALTGEAPFEFEWEPTNDLNAVNAREHASMSKDQATEEVEEGWIRLQAVLARMTEGDWSRERIRVRRQAVVGGRCAQAYRAAPRDRASRQSSPNLG